MADLRIIVVAILLLNVSLICQAGSIICGEEGTFMYPYYMTYEGSGGDNSFPPCAWCDSDAGKWSDAFTPTSQGTGCGCKSGLHYVAGVDGSSTPFTCRQCPVGSYKIGVSRVETCTPIIPTAEDARNTSVAPNEQAGTVPSTPEVTNSGTDTICPLWIVASIAVMISMALVMYIANHFRADYTNGDLEAPLYDSKSTLPDTADKKMNADAGDVGGNLHLVKIVDNKTPTCM
jgi:hypothetical protein